MGGSGRSDGGQTFGLALASLALVGAPLLAASSIPLHTAGFRALSAVSGVDAVWIAGMCVYAVATVAYSVNRWIRERGETGRAVAPTFV